MKIPNAKVAYSDLRVRSADSLELVLTLYEMLTTDLHAALEAIQNRSIERRTNELNHALRVIEQLQGTLNTGTGGEAAKQLDVFYDFLRGRILEAQLRSSSEQLEELLGAVATVSGAWKQLQRDQIAKVQTESPVLAVPQVQTVHASWTA
jgi:flagellar secretion chaperone FliS